MRLQILIAGALLAALTAPVTLAQNIDFLHSGPIAYLNDVDKQIFSDTFNAALSTAEDGEKVKWSNPDSGNQGTIELLDTHEDYDTTCRTVRTFTEAGGREGGGVYRLCLAEDKTWQFAPRRRQPAG